MHATVSRRKYDREAKTRYLRVPKVTSLATDLLGLFSNIAGFTEVHSKRILHDRSQLDSTAKSNKKQ
jgi:hypothetical protein